MIGVATVWLFLCIPQCLPQNNTTEATTDVHIESLKLTEKESHGHIEQDMVSINSNLKSDLKEVPPEAKTLLHSSNMEGPSLTENESDIVAGDYHNSDSQATKSTRSFEESPISDLKIPEIFAPVKDKHKKHDVINPIHKPKSVESNNPTRVTLIEHTSTIHVQEAKVQVGIPKEVLDDATKAEKTDKIDDATDGDNLPDTPEVSVNIERTPLDEEIQLEKGPEPPESTMETQTEETTSESGDNMPSFNEWTQKRLAEQEQKESNVPPSAPSQGKTTPPKMRQKNYASADCGAKILGSNSEAQSAYAVLNGYHDEYMLNPCTAKIWLVIELCEPIQVKKIEVANFELFSSSPREFTVSSSDRFPTRDWSVIGSFEAKEEKTIQSFSLEQKMFHKFIKIELFSHYGSEHYCPLSLVRLYGTSELEVLDNDDDHSQPGSHDLDGDGLPDDYETPGELQSPNLFGSAKDAVMSIVKKAAEALSRDKNAQQVPQNITVLINATEEIDSNVLLSTSPNVTDQCVTVVQTTLDTQHEANMSDVEKMLSCSYHFLTKLLALEAVNQILSTCSLCEGPPETENSNVSYVQRKCLYLHVQIGSVRFSALCYLFRMNRSSKPTILQTELKLYPNVTEITPGFETPGIDVTMSATSTFETLEESTSTLHCENAESSIPSPEVASETPPLPESGQVVSSPDLPNGIVNSSQSLKELIQPTKTLKPDDVGGDLASEDIVESGKSSSVSSQEAQDAVEASYKEREDKDTTEDGSSSSQGVDGDATVVTASENLSDLAADKTLTASQSESSILDLAASDLTSLEFVSALDGIESSVPSVVQMTSLPPGSKKDVPMASITGAIGLNKTTTVNAVTGNTQKESVFVRLSNRIKALELNMSFSTQYLEELSQRYRKQMEEMQRAFNKTISALNETAKKAQEQDVKQQEIINMLQSQIDNLSATVDILLADRESLGAKILEPHVFIIFVELMLAAFMYALLRRHSVRYLRSLNISGDETLSDIPMNNLDKVPRLSGSEDSMVKRRNSFSGCSSSYNRPQRRPSEEALNISGTYADLMIVEPVIPIMVDQLKVGEGGKRKKQRHKKNSRETIDEALDENGLRYSSNLNRKQSVGTLAKTAGSLLSENKNIKRDRTNSLPLAHNNLKTTSCQETDTRWNCAKKRTVVATTGVNKKCCCPFNSSDFVCKIPNELQCNGIEIRSKNVGVTNGNSVRGIRFEDKSGDFVLKKILEKWFWWLRR